MEASVTGSYAALGACALVVAVDIGVAMADCEPGHARTNGDDQTKAAIAAVFVVVVLVLQAFDGEVTAHIGLDASARYCCPAQGGIARALQADIATCFDGDVVVADSSATALAAALVVASIDIGASTAGANIETYADAG